jgi:hypothetical protein
MKRNIIGRIATATAIAASVVVAQPASAQLFELNIAGSVNILNGPDPIHEATLDFAPFVSAHNTTTLPGLVTVEQALLVPDPTLISFGAINDVIINDQASLCSNCAISPFLTIGPASGFPGPGAYVFTLNGLTPGTPPANVIFGPVELSSTGTIGTSATMSGFGTVTGGIFGAATRNFTISFHASFDQDTPGGLVAAINGGGTRNVQFGADILISSIPEPATVALMGTGLVALFGVGLRRRMSV